MDEERRRRRSVIWRLCDYDVSMKKEEGRKERLGD